MPGINKLNNNNVVAGAGAVSFIEIEMLEAEAVAVFGVNAAHVDGFYRVFESSIEDTKKIKREFGAKIIQAENGVSIKQLTTKDDAMLDVTSLYGDVVTEKLFDLMEKRPRRIRGTRPAPDDAAAGSVVLFGIRNAFKVAGFEKEYGVGEVKRGITIQGSRTHDLKPSFVEEVVLIADETGWPASIADFKSDAI